MKRTLLVTTICALAILIAGASHANHWPGHAQRGPVARIIGAIDLVAEQVRKGFQQALGSLGDLAQAQFGLADGQTEILDGQAVLTQEVQRLSDLIGGPALGQPDLLLVPIDGKMCRYEVEGDTDDVVLVRVENVGTAPTGSDHLTTLVVVPILVEVPVSVPPLGIREQYEVSLPAVAPDCTSASSCWIRVEVDSSDSVPESHEDNNDYEIPCT